MPKMMPPYSLPYTPERLRWALDELGWSLNELARRIHTHPNTVRQFWRGKRAIPDNLAEWLEGCAAHMSVYMQRYPLPAGWRERADHERDNRPAD
jgi:transcriptional regulator with XRE-family HTH domain